MVKGTKECDQIVGGVDEGLAIFPSSESLPAEEAGELGWVS